MSIFPCSILTYIQTHIRHEAGGGISAANLTFAIIPQYRPPFSHVAKIKIKDNKKEGVGGIGEIGVG